MFLVAACGEGVASSITVDIKRAEWRGESILVTGGWAKGIATPPLCRMQQGRNGPVSADFTRDARVVLDGRTFSKEFVRKSSASGPQADYYVECTVSLDSGRSASDTMKVVRPS